MIEKRYITTTVGQIHLRLTKEPTKPPLILLHQTASSSAMYEKIIDHLHDRFWCIAPDMLGFGQSDTPLHSDPSISLHATTFWELLDTLNIKSCRLFGHHTGASVALQMTHDRPRSVTGLGLSGPPLLSEEQIVALRSGLRPIELNHEGQILIDTWQRLRKKEPKSSLELTLRETLLTLQAGDNYPAAYQAVFDHPFAEQLASLRCPTLLMAGEHDSLYSSLEPACQCLPVGLPHLVKHISQAGSYICDLKPELVSKILYDFFGS